MIELEILRPIPVAERVRWKVQAEVLARSDPDGATWDSLLLAELGWFSCGPSGLVLIERLSLSSGPELFVYGLAGRGILAQGQAIMRDLKKIAKATGCTRVGGNSLHPALDRFYRGLGLKEVARQYRTELDG